MVSIVRERGLPPVWLLLLLTPPFVWISWLATQGYIHATRPPEGWCLASVQHAKGTFHSWNLNIVVPRVKAHQSFPVIFFVTGVAGNVPAKGYSDLLCTIANKGFVIVAMDNTGVPNYREMGGGIFDALEWARAGNLAVLMRAQGFVGEPDLHRASVMGQSAGNHILGEALSVGCSLAKAFIMVDPVDGFDPFGIVPEFLIQPGKPLNFTIPSLLISTGLDPLPLNSMFPACAPMELSNDRFYHASRGPIWNINATEYGHLDCMNDDWSSWLSFIACPSSKHGDKALYRGMIASSVSSFLRALFEGHSAAFTLLESPTNFYMDVALKHNLKGLKRNQVRPGCSHQHVFL